MNLIFKYAQSNDAGEIQASGDITNDMVKKVSFNETVGDEKYIKYSDISLTLSGTLNYNSTYHNWLFVYILRTGTTYELYSSYTIESSTPDSYDEKYGFYEYKLKSAQWKIVEALKLIKLEYTTTTTDWNYGLQDAFQELYRIGIKTNDTDWVYYDHRAVFALGDILDVPGSLKESGQGFVSYGITHNIPGDHDSGNIPVYLCGFPFIGDDDDDIIQTTFGDRNTNWWDIFKLAASAYNAVIKIIPFVIASSPDSIGLKIELQPRVGRSGYTAVADAQWIERKKIKNKYNLDGVELNTINHTYENGDINGASVKSADVDIACPRYKNTEFADDPYLIACVWSDGSGSTDFRANTISDWFDASYIDDYYEDMIDGGDGYTGKMLIKTASNNLIKTLDVIQLSTIYAQILNISFEMDEIAEVELIKL